MAVLVWVSMGTALWHFTFLSANSGAVLAGMASRGFELPRVTEASLGDAAVAFIGTVLGLACSYYWGTRLGRRGRRPGSGP